MEKAKTSSYEESKLAKAARVMEDLEENSVEIGIFDQLAVLDVTLSSIQHLMTDQNMNKFRDYEKESRS